MQEGHRERFGREAGNRSKSNNGVNLGYEAKLWATTNALPNQH